jgi:hypothetical protein
MAAIRTLLRKYWILVVILLWIVAWANRDRLAGGDEVATATVAETEETVAPNAGTPPSAPAPVSDPEPSSAAAKTANEGAVTAAPTASKTGAPARGAAPEAAVEATTLRTAPPEASAAEARGAAKPEPAAGMQPARPEAPATEGRGGTEALSAPELLAQTRGAYRSRGPRGAAEVLARGLADIPQDAPERADLLGELGNFYISAGDIPRALAAYDRALMALSAEARGPMIGRLAPVYDRFHPAGRSHLEQFR